jgi:hypothetical protein
MRYLLFWDVTQHISVVTDVSGYLIGPAFRDLAVQASQETRKGTGATFLILQHVVDVVTSGIPNESWV